jgi:hypothetical protein
MRSFQKQSVIRQESFEASIVPLVMMLDFRRIDKIGNIAVEEKISN